MGPHQPASRASQVSQAPSTQRPAPHLHAALRQQGAQALAARRRRLHCAEAVLGLHHGIHRLLRIHQVCTDDACRGQVAAMERRVCSGEAEQCSARGPQWDGEAGRQCRDQLIT